MIELPSIERLYAAQLSEEEQLLAYANAENYFPTRKVARGDQECLLQSCPIDLSGGTFVDGGRQVSLEDYLSLNSVEALLVMKSGNIVHEHYKQILPDQRWMSMSMAKSVSTTLVGAAIEDGYIQHLDQHLIEYIPELIGSGYHNVTIRQLLLMSSGVAWGEHPTVAGSDRRNVLELQLGQQAGSILGYMCQLPSVAAPGEIWNYSTGETHLVGELVRRATGHWLADYFSDRIWSRIGVEQDAEWWLESENGLEIAGSGLCATLRDYARFGLFVLNDGVIEGKNVVPEGWFREASGPTMIGEKEVNYGYMWWSEPSQNTKPSDAAVPFSAKGIFGQRLYINPVEQVVIGAFCNRAQPMYSEVVQDHAFFEFICRSVSA